MARTVLQAEVQRSTGHCGSPKRFLQPPVLPVGALWPFDLDPVGLFADWAHGSTSCTCYRARRFSRTRRVLCSIRPESNWNPITRASIRPRANQTGKGSRISPEDRRGPEQLRELF